MAAATADVFLITETWLTSSIHDSEVVPVGFTMLRTDRGGVRRGGGVAVAASPRYQLHRIDVTSSLADSGCELVCAGLYHNNNLLLVVLCVYIPPNAKDEMYETVFTEIESVLPKYDRFLICGDFNLNSANTNIRIRFEYLLSFCDLQQINCVCNSAGGMLDLVLVNASLSQITVRKEEDWLVPPDDYHPPLSIQVSDMFVHNKCVGSNVDSAVFTGWNFKKADFCNLYRFFENTCWDSIYEISDPDEAVSVFYKIIKDCINNCVPIKLRLSEPPRYIYPVWYSDCTKRNIKLKAYHHRCYKKNGNVHNRQEFMRLRAMVKLNIKEDFQIYKNKVESNLRRDPSTFWRYITSKRRVKKSEVILSEGKPLSDEDGAQLFAQYFRSVYANNPPILNADEAIAVAGSESLRVHIDAISLDDVELAFRRLNAKCSAGPDGIPPYIVKDCKSVFLKPICYLFNLCLSKCIYPEVWKISRVVPIPKGNSKSDVSDFRPVAILSTFGKLFESILHFLISKQLQNRLTDCQHGFRPGRSTATNLLSFWTYVTDAVDCGSQVDAAYFDIKKAFDSVDNDVLLHKLSAAGFSPLLTKFFSNYLRNRRQFVQYNGSYSEPYYTYSGTT
ncbi:uncharacterized protein LOC131847957 [Achroia grisella]|uniref:uncharacterized protein LOC131847957 n=1 Tax=Achroia grisella TaxID=688607 RepID=UPI0027D1FDA2|nr:uncharacterized protein LOC131847957 [Achroia grisella]